MYTRINIYNRLDCGRKVKKNRRRGNVNFLRALNNVYRYAFESQQGL